MSTEWRSDRLADRPADRTGDRSLELRAAVHAALADPARLKIVDLLSLGDAAPSELAARLGMPSNLLAHHTGVLEAAGLISRRRSDADRRRTYLTLDPARLVSGYGPELTAARVLFVCTANTARSHLAAAVWQRHSRIPATSAGTHPGDQIAPGAVAAAERYGLRMPRRSPRHIEAVQRDGDLIITVCDSAHEELAGADQLHWSVPDPVPGGRRADFDRTVRDLTARIGQLSARVSRTPS